MTSVIDYLTDQERRDLLVEILAVLNGNYVDTSSHAYRRAQAYAKQLSDISSCYRRTIERHNQNAVNDRNT